MTQHAEELATLIALENGKALADARGEIAYAAEFFRWYAEEATRIPGEFRHTPSGSHNILVDHGLRLGEDFSVGTDTHFEVLRPKTELLEQFLDLGRLVGTGDEAFEIVAEDGGQPAANFLRAQRVALGLLLDHALQHGSPGYRDRTAQCRE